MKYTLALIACYSSAIVSAFPWSEPKQKESFNWRETDYLYVIPLHFQCLEISQLERVQGFLYQRSLMNSIKIFT